MASRSVIEADARVWLAENASARETSVVTSLPDVSEVPLGFDEWRAWFRAAARQILEWIPSDGSAIFYQSDIRHHGAWIDKGYLVMRAAEDAGIPLAWHKIVCRLPAGTISLGRSTYSHMLCFSRNAATTGGGPKPGPDVIDAGEMTWTRAMGVNACRLAVRWLKDNTPTKLVVDPYCGHGTALAVANDFGLDSLGVDLSAKRCRAARKLSLASAAPAPE